MASLLPPVMGLQEQDVKKMLACQVHIGSKNIAPGMERYVWKRRSDGVYIIDLRKTWEKLVLAARVIVAIENPSDVCVISARPYGQRAILKFARYVGAQAITGRFTPGTFTNQIQEKFMEPRLLVVTDPRTDHQPIRESSYVNIPTIALCHTDSPLLHVDIAIPCNNKAKHAVGLMWWLLAREVLYLRNSIPRSKPWDVMVDLFLYREPEESTETAGKEELAVAPLVPASLESTAATIGAMERPAESWVDGVTAVGDWGGSTGPQTDWVAEPTGSTAVVGNWDSTPTTVSTADWN